MASPKKDRRSEKARPGDSLESDIVKLRPLFGYEPVHYVPVLYGVAALLLLLALLVLPGVLNHGSRVRFVSDPPGAEVFLNGIRVGSTPLEIFVPAGSYELGIRKAYLEDIQQEIEVSGRRFGSLLFPRRVEQYHRLTFIEDQAQALAHEAVREYAAWAAVGTSSRQFRFPMVLSDAVDTLLTAAYQQESESRLIISNVLDQSLGHVIEPSLLRDYVRAVLLAHATNPASGPGAIMESVQFFAQLHERSEALPILLSEALPPDERERLREADTFQQFMDRKATAMVVTSYEELPTELPRRSREILGNEFVFVPGGVVPLGQSRQGREAAMMQLPYAREIPAFEIMSSTVTRAHYAEFMSDEPQWHPDNREELLRSGMINNEYLRDWFDDVPDDRPVTYVSHYAAQAYADWFNENLASVQPEYRVRLPHEAEFEWASLLDASDLFPGNFRERQSAGPRGARDWKSGNLGLYHMMGNVWEWQYDYFAPAAYLLGSGFTHGGVERVVRGGAWVNSSSEVEPSTRGAHHPAWSSPFTGFRLVLVPVEQQ